MIFATESLDILEIEKEQLESLINNLTKTIPEITEHLLQKSAKKTLKATLKVYKAINRVEGQTFLGYKFDYNTLKDFSLFKNFEKQLKDKTQITEDSLVNIINSLNRIQHKRPVQLLKMFSAFPDLLPSLCSVASSFYKEKKPDAGNSNFKGAQIPNELICIAEFIILNFNYSKNKVLHLKYSNIENLKLTDDILNDQDIRKAGEPSLNLLFDFIFSIAKTYRNTILKSFVKILFVESQACTREKLTDTVTKIEYGNNLYQSNDLVKYEDKEPLISKENAEKSIDNMEVEGENLSEDEMLKLAIQMSLSQEEKKREEEEAQRRQSEIQNPEPIIEEDSATPQRYLFSFYRFDLSRDLFDMLFIKIAGVKERFEEFGLMFKLIYKILKMQQLVSYRLQIPMDQKYVISLAEILYEKVSSFLFF